MITGDGTRCRPVPVRDAPPRRHRTVVPGT